MIFLIYLLIGLVIGTITVVTLIKFDKDNNCDIDSGTCGFTVFFFMLMWPALVFVGLVGLFILLMGKLCKKLSK